MCHVIVSYTQYHVRQKRISIKIKIAPTYQVRKQRAHSISDTHTHRLQLNFRNLSPEYSTVLTTTEVNLVSFIHYSEEFVEHEGIRKKKDIRDAKYIQNKNKNTLGRTIAPISTLNVEL